MTRLYFCDKCDYPDKEKYKLSLEEYNNYWNGIGTKPTWDPFVCIYNSCLDCPKFKNSIKGENK